MSNIPVKLLNYGLSQLGNINKHLLSTTERPKYVLLLDDDDLLISTPATDQFNLGRLYMSCNDEGQPYGHTSSVTSDTVEEYMQIWDHRITTDFSGTVVTTDDLVDFFSNDNDNDSDVADVTLMRFLLSRNKATEADPKPWVWGRCKQEPSTWKLKTIKQLEDSLKVVSTLARAKVPGYSAKMQNIESIIQSLRSNIYIEPFADQNVDVWGMENDLM